MQDQPIDITQEIKNTGKRNKWFTKDKQDLMRA